MYEGISLCYFRRGSQSFPLSGRKINQQFPFEYGKNKEMENLILLETVEDQGAVPQAVRL